MSPLLASDGLDDLYIQLRMGVGPALLVLTAQQPRRRSLLMSLVENVLDEYKAPEDFPAPLCVDMDSYTWKELNWMLRTSRQHGQPYVFVGLPDNPALDSIGSQTRIIRF